MARRLQIEEATAQQLLSGFIAVIEDECRDLNRVALPMLGSFQGVKREEKVVRDLSSGRNLLLPPAIEIEFIPGGRLKNGIAEGPEK